MSMNELKPGDVVRLKSGGPAMTVEHVESGWAQCAYFAFGKSHDCGAPVAGLTVLSPWARFWAVCAP